MGYHITVRRPAGSPEISKEEFAHAVAQITDLRYEPIVGKAELYRDQELVATMMLQDGEIWTKVAEPEVIRKMVSLATILDAKAYGDEEEWYSESGEAHFPPGALEAQAKKVRRTERQRLITNIVKMSILAIVITMIVLREMKK